jgi:hypothetical protein
MFCAFVFYMSFTLGISLVPTSAQAVTTVGPYQQTCFNISFDKAGTLTATCAEFFGNLIPAKMAKATDCPKKSITMPHPGTFITASPPLPVNKGEIWDVDGALRCVFFHHPSQSGRDTFDIISMTESEGSTGKTTNWRIDHPDVINPISYYPMVSFKQGDQIKINANGCVQTGGSGDTWKRYVDPQGSGADTLYAGLLSISGVTPPTPEGTPQRILYLLYPAGGSWLFPVRKDPDAPKQSYLVLGYQDDGYGDNGYYSPDGGNPVQCGTSYNAQQTGWDDFNAAAWVEITIFSPKTVDQTAQRSPYRQGKNFDVTWMMDDSGVDDNGLPMNPIWSYQVANPGKMPDFDPSCQNSDYFDWGMPTCTSQNPSQDVNSGFFSSIAQDFGYCDPGPPHGHVNWAIVTYQGTLEFRGYSGTGHNDDDLNFGLITPDNGGRAANSEIDDGVTRPGIGVEFKKGETTDNFGTPFWQHFDALFSNGDNTNYFGGLSVDGLNIDGADAVVTALMGVDGVHGGYAELHPVFAMAIKTKETTTDDGVEQTWDFFVRNEGNQGSCASNAHDWPSQIANGSYVIQLPWPQNATDATPTVTAGQMYAPSQSSFAYLGMEVLNRWSFLRFQLPSFTSTGIDGQLTIRYALAKSAPKKSDKADRQDQTAKARTSHGDSDEAVFGVNWSALSARIVDPAVRQRFLDDVDAAFRASATHYPRHAVSLPIVRTVAAHHPKKDFAAWRGKLTRDGAKPEAEKLKEAAALKVVLEKYSAQLKLTVPAN